MMFNLFDCDRLTVPSCEEHNNNKSHKDQAIVAMLLMGVQQMMKYKLNSSDLPKDVINAINQAEKDFHRAKELLVLRPIFKATSEESTDDRPWDFPYLEGRVNTVEWMRQLTAAIIWSATGVPFDGEWKWTQIGVFSPDFIPAGGAPSFAELNAFKDRSEIHAMLIELLGSGWFALFEQLDRLNLIQLSSFLGTMSKGVETPIDACLWWRGWSATPRAYPANIYHFAISFSPLEGSSGRTVVIFKHVFYTRIRWYVSFVASETSAAALMALVVKPGGLYRTPGPSVGT
jgi:hypothetical protein